MAGKCRSSFGEGAEVAPALQICPKVNKQPLDFLRSYIFDLEQEFTAQRVPPSPPAFARSLPPREAKPPFIA